MKAEDSHNVWTVEVVVK